MKLQLENVNLREAVRALVDAAEQLFPAKSGAEKRRWVIAQINARIDIPVLNERQEAVLIGVIIDLVAAGLKHAGQAA